MKRSKNPGAKLSNSRSFLRRLKTRRKSVSKSRKLEFRILAMLAFFSISVGLWENFRQLWLGENGFSAQDVSTITSIGIMLSAFGVVIVGRYLRPRHLRQFMFATLVVKAFDLVFMVSLNSGGSKFLIDGCIIVDVLTSCLIITSVYPLITTFLKSNKAYSRRKLVEYLFRDLGVLVGGILIGWSFFGLNLNYNHCLWISAGFLVPAMALMFSLNVHPTERRASNCIPVLKYILSSKLQRWYMLYAFLAATSFAAALSLKMLALTDYLHLSASAATNYLLVVGLLSDVVGIVALRHFTPKNDYITLFLKFGLRLLSYVIVVLSSDPFLSLLAMTWSILISTAFEDVTDGHYINLVDNRHQFSYSTIKYVMSYLGEACGTLICGLTYEFGISAMFGVSAVITGVQLAVAFHLISIRHRRRSARHSASRLRYNERLVNE